MKQKREREKREKAERDGNLTYEDVEWVKLAEKAKSYVLKQSANNNYSDHLLFYTACLQDNQLHFTTTGRTALNFTESPMTKKAENMSDHRAGLEPNRQGENPKRGHKASMKFPWIGGNRKTSLILEMNIPECLTSRHTKRAIPLALETEGTGSLRHQGLCHRVTAHKLDRQRMKGMITTGYTPLMT